MQCVPVPNGYACRTSVPLVGHIEHQYDALQWRRRAAHTAAGRGGIQVGGAETRRAVRVGCERDEIRYACRRRAGREAHAEREERARAARTESKRKRIEPADGDNECACAEVTNQFG